MFQCFTQQFDLLATGKWNKSLDPFCSHLIGQNHQNIKMFCNRKSHIFTQCDRYIYQIPCSMLKMNVVSKSSISSFLGIPSQAPFIPFGYKNNRHSYQEDICPRGLQWRSIGRTWLNRPGWPQSSSWGWPSWAVWSRLPRTWTCGTCGHRCNICRTWTTIMEKYPDPGKWS